MSNSPGWLNPLLGSIGAVSQSGGGKLQPEPFAALNVIGGTVQKNPATGNVDLTIPSSAAGGQGNSLLTSGLNSNIPPAAGVVQRVYGPASAFSVGGWNDVPSGGQERTIINTTAQPMTVLNEDASTGATGRIDTQSSGSPIVLQPKVGSVVCKYDATDPGSGGAAGRWVVQNVGIHRPVHVNVQDYGAVGDDVHDDTAAIQAALNIFSGAASTRSGAVFFPEGTYLINGQLTFTGNNGTSVRIVGVCAGIGGYGSRIRWGGAAGGTMFVGTAMNGCSFCDVVFDGANKALWVTQFLPQRSPVLVGSANNVFERCVFHGFVGAQTTIAAGSNGLSFPQATINVASTAGLPAAGLIMVYTGGGGSTGIPQQIFYTGLSGGNQLTGCTGGSGQMTTGALVVQPSAAVVANDGTATDEVALIGFTQCYFIGDTHTDSFAGFLGLQSAIGNTEQFKFTGCTFTASMYGFCFPQSQNEMQFDNCGWADISIACIAAYKGGHIDVIESGFENTISSGPYSGRGQFVKVSGTVKTHIQSSELIADVSSETLCAMFTAGGGSLVLDTCDVEGDGQIGGTHQVAASITMNRLAPVTVRGCRWTNVDSPHNPAAWWQRPVDATTHIPINDGGNWLTDPSAGTGRVAIRLENNILQDVSGTLHNELPYFGVQPSFGAGITGMYPAGISAGVQIVARGEPRQTTTIYEIDYTALPAQTAAKTFLLESVQSKFKIIAVVADTTTAFQGGAGASLTLAVGDQVPHVYLTAHDIKTAPVTKGLAVGDLDAFLTSPSQGGTYLWTGAGGGAMTATFTGDGVHNLSTFTQGKVRIMVTVEYLDTINY
jgi:hypothetical protein